MNIQVFNKFTLISAFILLSSSLIGQNPDFVLSKDLDFSDIAPRDGMYIVGRTQNTPGHTSDNAGTWITLPDGSKRWQYEIYAPGANALDVYFDKITLPADASMFLRSLETNKISGPFRKDDIYSDMFSTGIVPGERAVLEVYIPTGVSDSFYADITEVGYHSAASLNVFEKDLGDLGSSDPCQVNANCSEGGPWTNQRRSAVKIIVKDGSLLGFCSGSLINNTAQDCKNYILTAQHCGSGASIANFGQWKFYFNFQSPTCANPASAAAVSAIDDQLVVGAVKRASSGDASIISSSDFLLLELISPIPASFNPYYIGWNNLNLASASGVCFHHPSGDIKKVSTYNSNLYNSSWNGTTLGTHWGVQWASTANGHGVTEGGSSGSGILDNVGRLKGVLSGGSSECTFTSGNDAFGKFSYSWTSVGTTPNRQLKPWLDPNNSGVSTLDGRNACVGGQAPVANFYADQNFVVANTMVSMFSTSTNYPTSYNWTITPNTGIIYNVGSNSTQFVGVRFFNLGCYTVTLTATNAFGSDVETKTSYICVTPMGNEESQMENIQVYPNPASDHLYFNLPDGWNGHYSILSVTGKLISTDKLNSTQLPISHLANGLYVIKLTSQSGSKVIPFIKAQ